MVSISNRCFNLALVLVVVTALSAMAAAKDESRSKEGKTLSNLATVVGHIPLVGPPATQMFLQQRSGGQYLYIDQGSSQGYSIIDVSHPDKPKVIKHVDHGKLEVVGNSLALAESPQEDSKTIARSKPSNETVKMLDMSDPANPRIIRSFSGVTSVLADQGRNLVYIANDEGLWVIRQRRRAPQLPPCTSSDAMAANPDCM